MFPSGFLLVFFAFPCVSPQNIPKQAIILERAIVINFDKDYVIVGARVNKINRTSYALDSNVTVLKDWPPASVKMETYAEFSNEYRQMPINIHVSMCQFYEICLPWFKAEIKQGRIPESCNIKKGFYYIKNYIPDLNKLPFKSPWDKLKVRFNLYQKGTGKSFVMADVYIRFV